MASDRSAWRGVGRLVVVAMLALPLLGLATSGCKKKKKEEPAPAAAAPPPVAQPAQPAQPAVAAPPPVAAPAGVNAGLFSIPKATFTRGERILVTFHKDMTTPPGQQHWITLAKPTDVESAWGTWHYVPQGATSDVLTPNLPGEWEIRLHDIYPRWASRVIARQRITVM